MELPKSPSDNRRKVNVEIQSRPAIGKRNCRPGCSLAFYRFRIAADKRTGKRKAPICPGGCRRRQSLGNCSSLLPVAMTGSGDRWRYFARPSTNDNERSAYPRLYRFPPPEQSTIIPEFRQWLDSTADPPSPFYQSVLPICSDAELYQPIISR